LNRGYAIVGRIRKPHGIHGDLVVEPLTVAPDVVFASGRRVFTSADAQGLVSHEVLSARPFKGVLILALRGVRSRDAADALRDVHLFVPQDELAPLAEGEVWLHELRGMRVVDTRGAYVGDVQELDALPQGLMLTVHGARGDASIPFVDSIVVRVDREGRVLTIDPPEGLLDL
jgi:16S rRNA processing protein RimM